MGGATARDTQQAPWYKRAWDWTYSTYEKVYVMSNREPLLTIRRVVWWASQLSMRSVVPASSSQIVYGENPEHAQRVLQKMWMSKFLASAFPGEGTEQIPRPSLQKVGFSDNVRCQAGAPDAS